MYANAHAAGRIRSIPDAATDEVLDGAYAGWDAEVYIAPPGDDPFEGIDDDDLIHAHAGVMAATIMAQANQMRVLDSAIVPDRDLVRPTLGGTNKFNEFDVYTPTTLAERYAVINEDGVEEVVIPTSPFFPGLAERPSAAQNAVQLKLEDAECDPYAISLATATVLLQTGIEAGHDVGPVAEILNKAWGLDAAFSPGTVVGLAGTHDYAASFAQDRNTNARRLASWQETSYVRSGQLSMQTTDWGPTLHCDFRRVRVAAESLFATAMAAETSFGNVRPTGSITYHVPSTSLLAANPEFLFFQDAAPELMPKQKRCPAAKRILDRADAVGVLRALWPSTEPVIADTWAASFGTSGGLTRAPVQFLPSPMTAAPLFSASTATLVRKGRSFAKGLGRTVMTTLSARLASMAEGVVDISTVSWMSRFAAVVEIMRLSTSRVDRAEIAALAWRSLAGETARSLEKSMANAHMKELKKALPARLKGSLSARSARIPVYALLLEVGNPKTAVSHTVLRGLRRCFARAATVAKAVTVRERVGWTASSPADWLIPRLTVVREFWAVQFAALGQVAHVAAPLRADLRWWVDVSAIVNSFRAGVMRGFAVAKGAETVAGYAQNVPIRLKPYHAAAHLRKALSPYLAMTLPPFAASANIATWAKELVTHTSDYVARQERNIPRVGRVGSVSDHTSHFARGATLLMVDKDLGDWVTTTTALVIDDCEALLAQRAAVMATASTPTSTKQAAAVSVRLAAAVQTMAVAVAKIHTTAATSNFYASIEEEIPEDTWDEFLEAAWDDAHPTHEMAKKQLAAAKVCSTESAAAGISRWILHEFAEEVPESLPTIA